MKNIFNSDTKLEEKEDKTKITYTLKKSFLSIILNEYRITNGNKEDIKKIKNNFDKIKKLKNLLESLFQMKLASDKEPILLIGPKCYKSYAAKIILENATEVSLNSESTVSQLLGSHYFFSKTEHKIFIISKIYEILILMQMKLKIGKKQKLMNLKKK